MSNPKKDKETFSFFLFLKNHPLDLLLFSLLFIFAFFCLPATEFWSSFIINRPKKYPSETLAHYQSPPQPILKTKLSPAIFANAYIVLDQKTNLVLASKNDHLRLAPASTTKLISALTALNIYPLNELVTVQEAYLVGKNMELQIGETLTVSDLVSGLLIHSANDAAYTLARHNTASVSGFIKQMNQLSKRYDLQDTNFVNFDGLDHPDHYSSAYDLSQIARLSLKNDIIRKAVSTQETDLTDLTGVYSHHLENTNELLGAIPEVKGLKTGWTDLAGECFIGLIEVDGHELITVVLGSTNRFLETQKMIDWIKDNVVWQ